MREQVVDLEGDASIMVGIQNQVKNGKEGAWALLSDVQRNAKINDVKQDWFIKYLFK